MATSTIDKQSIVERLNMREYFGEFVEMPRNSKTEILVRCCFHEDSKPSLSINTESGMWRCHGCKAEGDIFTWYMKHHNVQFAEALRELANRVGLFGDQPAPVRNKPKQAKPETPNPPIDEALVMQFHDELLSNESLYRYFTDQRGLTIDTLQEYKIGWSKERHRYTLPVYEDGKCVNIRMYKPNPAAEESKIESWAKGYGSVRLYPNNTIDSDDVILCEGELDCLIARQNGFNVWTTTGGCESFSPFLCKKFTGKKVTICYDIDAAGRKGAKRTAGLLVHHAKEVRIADLPIQTPDNGDISDFFIMHRLTASDFQDMLDISGVYKNGQVKPGTREFRGLIPPGSYFDLHTEHASEITDAPVEFHLASGLATISAVVGNNIWFNVWGQDVFLNLWTLLLAPSGFYRKTTSQRIGIRLVSSVTPEYILPSDFTQEKMVENLAAKPSGIISVTEFGAMLKQLNKDYNGSLKEFLTEIYDVDHYVRDTKGGRNEINRPSVSIIAASTIDWLIGNAKNDDMHSGFFARWLFWPATKKNGWKGIGEYAGHDDMMVVLKYMLTNISQVRGRATFSKEFITRYNQWLQKFENEVNTNGERPELQGFYTRLATYVLKFSVLYELSSTCDLDISIESLEYAIKLAEYLKSHLIQLFEEDIALTAEGRELKFVRSIIERDPGLDRQTLLRKSKLTAQHLDKLLMTLIQAGEVNQNHVTQTGGRPKVTYFMGEESSQNGEER